MRQGVESDQPLKSKAEAYGTKAQKYFSGQRRDFIDKSLDLDSGRMKLRSVAVTGQPVPTPKGKENAAAMSALKFSRKLPPWRAEH